jgi:hypothetical protein
VIFTGACALTSTTLRRGRLRARFTAVPTGAGVVIGGGRRGRVRGGRVWVFVNIFKAVDLEIDQFYIA